MAEGKSFFRFFSGRSRLVFLRSLFPYLSACLWWSYLALGTTWLLLKFWGLLQKQRLLGSRVFWVLGFLAVDS